MPSNRTLLTAGYRAAQATLLLELTEKAGTLHADGPVGADRRTRLIDRSL